MKKHFISLMLVLFCGSAFCATVVLKNGNVIKGEIVNATGDFVEIKTSFGEFKFTQEEVKSLNYDIYSIKLKEGTVLKSEILENTDEYIKIMFSGSEVKIPKENILFMEPAKTQSDATENTAQKIPDETPTMSADQTATGLGAVSASAVTEAISGQSAISQASPQDMAVVDLTPGNALPGDDYSQMKYTITLKNGKQLTATILDMNEDSIQIATDSGRQTLVRTSILSIVAQAQAFTPEPQTSYTPTHIVTLKSGSKIECEIVGETQTKIKMITEYGLTEISKNGILSVEKIADTKREEKSPQESSRLETEKQERREKFNKKIQEKFQKKEPLKELSVIIGLWKPPLKLDLSDEGGPDSVSLDDNAITYGLRYMFYRYANFYIGISGAMQAIAKKDLKFTGGETAQISGEAGYLQLTAYLPANSNKSDGPYLVAGAGFGITRLNYRIENGTTKTPSISTIQPIFSVGAGWGKQTKSVILGVEASWSYEKQKDDKLSKSDSGFLSVSGKLSWRFN